MVQGVNRILILDCGSQFTQLIARRIREASVYCEIHPAERGKDVAFVKRFDPRGVILSGGPNSVFEDGAPTVDSAILDLGMPVLGICSGMQLIAHLSGGKAAPASAREYGRADVTIQENKALFAGFTSGESIIVWARHGDRIATDPPHSRGWVGVGTAPSRAAACCFIPKSRTRRAAARSCTTSCSTSAAARRRPAWCR